MKIAPNPLFLIGSQRSGTTWVANVLNRSREVALFFEPLQKGLTLFQDFPEEPVHVQAPSEALSADFVRAFHAMLQLEETFLNHRLVRLPKAPAVLNAVLQTPAAWAVLSKINRLRNLQVVNQFRTRNFASHFVPKNAVVRPLVKETRLHLKLPLLLRAFPDTRIGVLVRHPYPVIQSATRWMARGSLGELRRKLAYFFDVYETQVSLQTPRFRQLLELARTGTVSDKLLAHWLISNELAYAFCQQHAASARVVFYEALCRRPVDEFRRLFEFFGLGFDQEVREAILQTSAASEGTDDLMETRRASQTKYKEWVTADLQSDKLYQKIVYFSEEFETLAQMQKHYQDVLPTGAAATTGKLGS